jgi:heat shock protein HslJ
LADKYILNKKNDETKINSLINTKWIITELRGKTVELKNPNKKIFLVFNDKKNKVHGFAGCNNFNGTYKLEGNGRIKFSENMAMTMMACPDMEIEQAFIKVLAQADNYNLNENKLVINKARMAPLARFEAEQLRTE